MSKTIEKTKKVRAVGKSWVIRLPKTFTDSNKLETGTQVLLTIKKGEQVNAEILPPLSKKLLDVAETVLQKRRNAYEELKQIGD